MILKCLASVLQAFAEELHEKVRKELWGYSKEEIMETQELLKVRYKVCCYLLLTKINNTFYL